MKSQLTRNVLTLISGTISAQAIPFFIAPVLSRMYSPEDFAVYGLFLSIVLIISSVASARYDTAIMLPPNNNNAANILFLSIFISFVTSGLLLFIFALFNDKIAFILNNKGISDWLYLVPVAVLIISVNSSFSYWMNRNKQYKSLACNKIIKNGFAALTNMGMGFAKMTQSGLIVGQFIGDALATAIFGYSFIKASNFKIKTIKKNKILELTREYKDFPLYSLPTTFFDNLSSQLPVLLISIFFLSSITGQYFFSIRILSIPAAILGTSIAQIFYQEFSECIRDKRMKDANILLFKIWKTLFLIGMIPTMIIYIYGPSLFNFIFGADWAESGRMASILAPYLLFAFVSSPTSTTYTVLRKQSVALVFGFVVVIYRTLSLLIGYYWNDFYLALKILVCCEICEILIYNILAYRYCAQRELLGY